jgi:FdhE protein
MRKNCQSKKRHLDFQRLRALDYLPKKHIDFFEKISEANNRAKDRLVKDNIYPLMSKEVAHEMLAQGFPLINFDRLDIRIISLRAHFKEICSILIQYEGSKPGPIEMFYQSEEYNRLDLKELIRKTLSNGSDYLRKTSEKVGVDEHTLRFAAVTLVRPLFEVVAEGMKTLLSSYPWWENYCPACGNDPFMAKIRREDGMRILQCSLCSMEWKFDRVKCPFCNNQDQKSLKFFYYHEESPYRLYVCDHCKRYIKCVDERKMEQDKDIDLSIEDMVTLYLDTLAQEQEYLPPSIF